MLDLSIKTAYCNTNVKYILPILYYTAEIEKKSKFSSLANHFADQMANDIREAKAPNEVVLGGIESPKEYKYEQIFSKETNWKAELEKNRFLYISQERVYKKYKIFYSLKSSFLLYSVQREKNELNKNRK